MENKRVLELALRMLNQMKAEVEEEIDQVRAELRSETGARSLPARAGRRPKTAAERREQSEKMKAYWAKRRMQKVSSTAKSVPAAGKRRPKTAAEKKALSRALKEAWARRRAEGARKT